MASALLTLVSTALVGTPIGWGIIGLVVVGGLVGRFAIRSDSMFDMINPKARKYQEIQEKLDGFDNKNENIDRILCKKKNQNELIRENARLKVMHEPVGQAQPRKVTCFISAAKEPKLVDEDKEADASRMSRRFSAC